MVAKTPVNAASRRVPTGGSESSLITAAVPAIVTTVASSVMASGQRSLRDPARLRPNVA